MINNNQWHHLVAVCEAVTHLYVDGVLTNQTASAAVTGSINKPLAIGTSGKYSQFFAGALAEVAVYPSVLTPAQIANHYALRTATGGGGRAPNAWGMAAVLEVLN